MNIDLRMDDILNREKEKSRHSFDAEALEEINNTKGEISNQSESKFSVDCSVQAGSPAVKMVRFTVETDRQGYTGYTIGRGKFPPPRTHYTVLLHR